MKSIIPFLFFQLALHVIRSESFIMTRGTLTTPAAEELRIAGETLRTGCTRCTRCTGWQDWSDCRTELLPGARRGGAPRRRGKLIDSQVVAANCIQLGAISSVSAWFLGKPGWLHPPGAAPTYWLGRANMGQLGAADPRYLGAIVDASSWAIHHVSDTRFPLQFRHIWLDRWVQKTVRECCESFVNATRSY